MLVLSLGLHWALLQTVAWTGMLVTYSRDASFQDAVSKTFDGEHPCALCKVIKSGRAEEGRQEQQQVKPGCKLDVAPVWQATEFDFACGRVPFPLTILSDLLAPTTLPSRIRAAAATITLARDVLKAG